MTAITELQKILRAAEKLKASYPTDDEQMHALLGGIMVNAEDAIGALQAELSKAQLQAMMRGGFTIQGK